MKKKSLGINAALNGIRSILNILFPLITFPYISRVLSVTGVGINNFSSTYVQYFVLIAQLGVSNYAVREGAKYRENLPKINKFANEVFTINIFSTLLAYILLIVTLLIFKNLQNYFSCILIYSLQVVFTTLGTEWIYVIYEDFRYITIRSIVFNVLSIIFLFLFVRNENDYLIYAGISVFATVGSNILNYLHAKTFINIRFVKNVHIQTHLKPILILFASEVSSTIYMSCDNTILGLLKSDYAVGIYGLSVKIYTAVKTIISALVMVTIPRLSMYYGQRNIEKYKEVFSSMINYLVFLALPATTGLFMLSKSIVLILGSKKYIPSILSLRIIVFATLFSIFSWVISACVLIPSKREKYILKSTIIASIVNISLNFIFIPIGSYNAAALVTVISEIVSLIINFYYGKDIVKDIIYSKKLFKNLFSSFLGCIGIVISCLALQEIIKNNFLLIVVCVFVSVAVYIVILLMLRNKIILNILSNIKEKI